MVLAPKERPKTYADYLAVPEGQRAELIHGELMMSPQPKARHIRAASMLGADLVVAFGKRDGPSAAGPGGWWIFDEPEVHLELDTCVLIPDLAGWRRERMPEPPSESHKWTLPPDWICEVLSPSTQARDYVVKLPLYREAGVEWAWIVDPAHQTVTVFQAVGTQWKPSAEAEGRGTVRLPPFDAAELDLSSWW